MKNDYFDLKKLMDDSSDKVDDELDNLNNEVCSITKGVGRIVLHPLHTLEAEHYFGDKMMDENYYLTFLYNNTKINSPVRNKFAVLSYAETYPVLVQSLKTEDSEVVKINNQKEFHKILKELVNDDSVLRSVRSAMNQKEAKK
jgi:hypothetical protein